MIALSKMTHLRQAALARRTMICGVAASLIGLIVALAAPAIPAHAQGDDEYNMVCRAGPGMQFHLTPTSRGAFHTLDILIQKAERGFEIDPAGLEPG